MAAKGKQKACGTALVARLVFVLYEVTEKLGSENVKKDTATGHSAGLLLLRISKGYCGEGFERSIEMVWDKILNFRSH